MKLPPRVVPPCRNIFNSFSFNDDSKQERQPSRDVMKAISKSYKTKPRDEDSSDDSDDDTGWLSSRNPVDMSALDKEKNAQVARTQRKALNNAKLKAPLHHSKTRDDNNKKRKLVSSSDEELTSPSPIVVKRKQLMKGKAKATSTIITSNKIDLQEEDGSEIEVGVIKSRKRTEEAEASLSDNESSEDEDVSWRDHSDDKGFIQLQATKILSACETISANLRQTLRSWGALSMSYAQDASNVGRRGCLNMVEIIDSSRSHSDMMMLNHQGQILNHQNFLLICPHLELKPYQIVGVNWLKLLHENKINGVLADDMGLGKTVQTIAFLGWLKSVNRGSTKVHLIVVPASTLSNWEKEFRRFCPTTRLAMYHGSLKERAEMRYELKRSINLGELDVILTTYTVFEREAAKDDRKFLYSLTLEYLVLDEAHCIKNPESSRYVKLASLQARNRLLLSGTPVQNDVGELLALLSFLMPKTFNRQDCTLLLEAFNWGSSKKDGGQLSIVHVRSMLAPFVLRRVKLDVLDQLVPKKTVYCPVEMSSEQERFYNEILLANANRKEKLRLKFEEEKKLDRKLDLGKSGATNFVDITDDDSDDSLIDLTSPKPVANTEEISVVSDGSRSSLQSHEECGVESIREMTASEARSLFTALRKVANHPLLLRKRYNDSKILDQIARVAHAHEHFGNQCDFARVRSEIEEMSDFDLHSICLEYSSFLGEYQLDSEALFSSPKMCKLREMLPKLIGDGHRVLLFSQWTRLLDLLEVLLEQMGLGYLRLDGSTPVKERQMLIDTFNGAEIVEDSEDSDAEEPNDTESYSSRQNVRVANKEDLIPIFLLSTKAGGLGINLSTADTVIFHDLDFNPENDKQAEDRCHRIGQTREVTVYKLVAKDTVDEDIFEMGEKKRQLSAAVLSEKSSSCSTPKVGDEVDLESSDIGAIGRMLQRALHRAQLSK